MRTEHPEKIILIGAGGHALSLAEFCGDRVNGYMAQAANPEIKGEWLGNDSKVKEALALGLPFHISFIYSGLPVMGSRGEIILRYEKAGAEFATLIAPTAIVTPNSVIGEGSAVMNGAIINRSKLGRHVVVNSGAIVEHDCEIGNNTFIGPGSVIGGFTRIGDNCFIGLGARISNGLTIGDNITVAMGAVVTRDLTEPGIYHGSKLKRYPLPV